MTVQRRTNTKDWRGGGGWTHTVKGICNQRWEYYPHKSTITLSSSPLGTRPSSNWPTSVLCVVDGRRSCPNESSWSPRWSPCSRLVNINNKIYATPTYTVSWNVCQESFTTCRHKITYIKSWGKSVNTCNSYCNACVNMCSSVLCGVLRSTNSAELN